MDRNPNASVIEKYLGHDASPEPSAPLPYTPLNYEVSLNSGLVAANHPGINEGIPISALNDHHYWGELSAHINAEVENARKRLFGDKETLGLEQEREITRALIEDELKALGVILDDGKKDLGRLAVVFSVYAGYSADKNPFERNAGIVVNDMKWMMREMILEEIGHPNPRYPRRKSSAASFAKISRTKIKLLKDLCARDKDMDKAFKTTWLTNILESIS